MSAIADVYLQWCKDNGILLSGVAAAVVNDGGRGIIATTDLQPGDAFLQVPADLLISRKSAESDPVLGPLLKQPIASGLDSYQVLAVHLLHEVSKAAECKNGSKWAPYLRELPRSYTTLSLFCTQAAQQLQVLSAVQTAEEAAEKVHQQWKQALPLLQTLGLPAKYRSVSAWRWAAATLLSRTMHVPWDKAGALTPFGDLLNHQSPPGPCTPQILIPPSETARNLSPNPSIHQAPTTQQAASPEVQTLNQGCTDAELHVDNSNHELTNVSIPSPACDGTVNSVPDTNTQCCQKDDGLRQQQATLEIVQTELISSGQQGTGNQPCNEAGQSYPAVRPDTALLLPSRTDPNEGGSNNQQRGAPRPSLPQNGKYEHQPEGQMPVRTEHQMQQEVSSYDMEANTCEAQGSQQEDDNKQVDESKQWLWGDGSYDAETHTYKLYARRRYSKGDQVYVSYGQHPNLELLELYGFVLSDNPHETVHIPLQLLEVALQITSSTDQANLKAPFASGETLSRMAPVSNRKGTGVRHKLTPTVHQLTEVARLLLVNPVSQENADTAHDSQSSQAAILLESVVSRLPDWLIAEDCFIYHDGAPSWHLLRALRYAVATPAERKSHARALAAGERISITGDIQALCSLHTACRAILYALPTTIQEDKELLAALNSTDPKHVTPVLEPEPSVSQPQECPSQPAARRKPTDMVQPASSTLEKAHMNEMDKECWRLAIQWRRGYKRLLTNCLQLAATAVRQLQEAMHQGSTKLSTQV